VPNFYAWDTIQEDTEQAHLFQLADVKRLIMGFGDQVAAVWVNA
jgi:hypothetical protein